MKSEKDVRKEAERLRNQLLDAERGTELYKIVEQRLLSLLWVIDHPKGPKQLVIDKDQAELLECLY